MRQRPSAPEAFELLPDWRQEFMNLASIDTDPWLWIVYPSYVSLPCVTPNDCVLKNPHG